MWVSSYGQTKIGRYRCTHTHTYTHTHFSQNNFITPGTCLVLKNCEIENVSQEMTAIMLVQMLKKLTSLQPFLGRHLQLYHFFTQTIKATPSFTTGLFEWIITLGSHNK